MYNHMQQVDKIKRAAPPALTPSVTDSLFTVFGPPKAVATSVVAGLEARRLKHQSKTINKTQPTCQTSPCELRATG